MPNIDADLHRAFPIRQRSDKEFMPVMSNEIEAVVFKSDYNIVRFFQ